MKVRRDDTVMVISGKDKGRTGKVLRAIPERDRVVVEGVNMVKRHQRPTQGTGAAAAGGVIAKEGPIHVSNVAILDPKDGKPTRIGVDREGGKRFRVARRTGNRID